MILQYISFLSFVRIDRWFYCVLLLEPINNCCCFFHRFCHALEWRKKEQIPFDAQAYFDDMTSSLHLTIFVGLAVCLLILFAFWCSWYASDSENGWNENMFFVTWKSLIQQTSVLRLCSIRLRKQREIIFWHGYANGFSIFGGKILYSNNQLES